MCVLVTTYLPTLTWPPCGCVQPCPRHLVVAHGTRHSNKGLRDSSRGGRWAEGSGSQGGRRQQPPGEGNEPEEEELGWWQVPEEKNLQNYAPPTLQQWQKDEMERAYVAGKRKVKVRAPPSSL